MTTALTNLPQFVRESDRFVETRVNVSGYETGRGKAFEDGLVGEHRGQEGVIGDHGAKDLVVE